MTNVLNCVSFESLRTLYFFTNYKEKSLFEDSLQKGSFAGCVISFKMQNVNETG
jgi:hypothetical protein